MAKKKSTDRELHGVIIQQRKADGYINATAMAKAHLAATGQRRDVHHWLESSRVQESIKHVSLKTGIPVFKLVEPKKGRYGGTFIHPKLATRFGIWLSDEFGFLVEEWIEEWMTTGENPLTQAEAERIEYRSNLKDEVRPRLTDQVMWHLKKICQYANERERGIFFARVHNAINLAITGETAKAMRKRLSKELGKDVKTYELIRDYFPAIELQRYIAICEVAANLMRTNVPPLVAVEKAADLALPAGYRPTPIDFTSHIKLVRRKAS